MPPKGSSISIKINFEFGTRVSVSFPLDRSSIQQMLGGCWKIQILCSSLHCFAWTVSIKRKNLIKKIYYATTLVWIFSLCLKTDSLKVQATSSSVKGSPIMDFHPQRILDMISEHPNFPYNALWTRNSLRSRCYCNC